MPRARATPSTGRRLFRFDVEMYEQDAGGEDWDWIVADPEERWPVLLPAFAEREEVEHALAVLGLYVPRGADRLDWLENGNEYPVAMIYDYHGAPMVRLWGRPCR